MVYLGFLLVGSVLTNHVLLPQLAGILGMGLAYAGTADESAGEYLSPFVADDTSSANMEVRCCVLPLHNRSGAHGSCQSHSLLLQLVAVAGLALGLVYVGTADEDVAATLVDRLMEATDAELNQAIARQLCLGLGLVFLVRRVQLQ